MAWKRSGVQFPLAPLASELGVINTGLTKGSGFKDFDFKPVEF